MARPAAIKGQPREVTVSVRTTKPISEMLEYLIKVTGMSKTQLLRDHNETIIKDLYAAAVGDITIERAKNGIVNSANNVVNDCQAKLDDPN